MRIVSKLLVAATAAAAITALAAAPALADPPAGVTPKPTDVVGVGSGTMQYVFDQFSHDYNATHSTGRLYSFDATNPATGAVHDPIQTKSGSTNCSIVRPDGSLEGVTALVNTLKTTSGQPCVDFARSTLARVSPELAPPGWVELAGDAVTVATQPGSSAPANLTTAELNGIYSCMITNWSGVGGSNAPISAFLPQNGSETRAFFLSAIGLTAPGPCVSTSATKPGAAGANDNTLQENEGVAPSLNTNKADVIVPFSVANWIAEHFHSASCGTIASCYAHPGNCHPAAGQNLFGCNTHGTMVLNQINGTAPTTGTGKATMINPGFTPLFTHVVSEVVNALPGSIPAYLQPYFGPNGWTCASAAARADLQKYGFLVLPNTGGPGTCGYAPPPPP